MNISKLYTIFFFYVTGACRVYRAARVSRRHNDFVIVLTHTLTASAAQQRQFGHALRQDLPAEQKENTSC